MSDKLFRITVSSRDGSPDLTVAKARYSLPLACAKDSMDGLSCSFLLLLISCLPSSSFSRDKDKQGQRAQLASKRKVEKTGKAGLQILTVTF